MYAAYCKKTLLLDQMSQRLNSSTKLLSKLFRKKLPSMYEALSYKSCCSQMYRYYLNMADTTR